MPLLLLVLSPEPQPDMGLEDEQRMLTGSGDPKEVRVSGDSTSFHSPEAQDLTRQSTGPSGPPFPTRVCRVGRAGFPVPFPRVRRVTLGK